MHGLGNDFMVVDARSQVFSLTALQISQLADRHRGVGFDQLLLIEKPRGPEMDFFYRIFNVDGNEAEQCGNGLRCITRFIYDKGLANKQLLKIGTQKGLQLTKLLANGLIEVVMGEPSYLRGKEQLQLEQHSVEFFSLGFGNPHAVIRVDELKHAPVSHWGLALNQHSHFPQGINVGFMQIFTPEHIGLRVYERAVGETLACGSGACAAVTAGQLQGLLAAKVKVSLPGGELWIERNAQQETIMLGPAASVYEGVVTI